MGFSLWVTSPRAISGIPFLPSGTPVKSPPGHRQSQPGGKTLQKECAYDTLEGMKASGLRLHWDIWSQLKSSISVQSFSWEGQSLAHHHKTEWVILKWLCKLSRSPGAHWSTFLSPALQEWFCILVSHVIEWQGENSVGSLVLNPVARGGHSHYQHMLVTLP